MSVSQPLLQTIEADDPTISENLSSNAQQKKTKTVPPVVLTPTTVTHGASSSQMATAEGDAESGKSYGIHL